MVSAPQLRVVCWLHLDFFLKAEVGQKVEWVGYCVKQTTPPLKSSQDQRRDLSKNNMTAYQAKTFSPMRSFWISKEKSAKTTKQNKIIMLIDRQHQPQILRTNEENHYFYKKRKRKSPLGDLPLRSCRSCDLIYRYFNKT